MSALYTDNNPFVCEWTQNMIGAGLIPPGKVLCKSITEITPDEIKDYAQISFFNGISGWPLALRAAGWPDERPIWSASAPCQPFSCAGKGKGHEDKRHLWPSLFALIRECRPGRIVGEQVEAAVGLGWLDRVFSDLEAEGYACGAVVLGAHSVGAPHRRQRIYWLADSQLRGEPRNRTGCGEGNGEAHGPRRGAVEASSCGALGGLANTEYAVGRREHQEQREPHRRNGLGWVGGNGGMGNPERNGRRADEPGRGPEGGAVAGRSGEAGGMDDLPEPRQQGSDAELSQPRQAQEPRPAGPGDTRGMVLADGARSHTRDEAAETAGYGHPLEPTGFWYDSRWHPCRDGKLRRVPTESAFQPLAHGLPRASGELLSRLGLLGIDPCVAKRLIAIARKYRVGSLRGYGNAICVPTAVEFIWAVMEATVTPGLPL